MNTKEQLTAKIAELQAQVDAMPDDKPVHQGRWKPETGQEHWYIGWNGLLTRDRKVWGRCDENAYSLGNCYPTKEAAEKARDKQLAYVRVVDRIAELNAEQGWVADWEDSSTRKYMFSYNYSATCLESMWTGSYQSRPTELYGSKETIETVIKEMPDDCKLVLGV